MYTRNCMKLLQTTPIALSLVASVSLAAPQAPEITQKPDPGQGIVVDLGAQKRRPSGSVPEMLRFNMTPDQMREDVATWKGHLEELCAGLFRYVSKEEFEELFLNLDARIGSDMALLPFFREMMDVASKLRHQKVGIVLPSRVTTRGFGNESNVLPLRVHIVEGRVWVLGTLGEEATVPRGSELLEIQGEPVSVVLQSMYDRMSAEGYTSSGKPWRLALGLPLYYALLVDETLAEFEITYKTPEGEQVTETLQGVFASEAFEASKPHAGKPAVDFETMADRKLAILTLRTLYERDLKAEDIDYQTYLNAVFVEIAETGIERLVLDLRGNQRGSDQHALQLLSHLVDKPARLYAYVSTAPVYNGNQETFERSDGTQVLFPYEGMAPVKPVETPFRGELVVLIDGGTFGAASDIASTLQRLGRATFVGEETSGVCDGSTIGTVEKLALPNSELTIEIPTLDYELFDVDPQLRGISITPHHRVVWSAEDRLAGKDSVREFVLGTLLK